MRFSSSHRVCSALVALSFCLGGCAFLIPEDPSAPRYNTVGGERRRPQLNSMTPQGSPAPMPTAPVSQNGVDDGRFPPVDQAVQARAQEQMGNGFSNARRTPIENAASEIMVSENNYPPLSDVPQRPPMAGDDSAASRLGRVRSELERDRVNSGAARDQLNRDAASEPSLLGTGGGSTLPPSPVFAPPPPTGGGQSYNFPAPAMSPSSLGNPRPVAYGGAPEPIQLRAPMPGAPKAAPSMRITEHAPAAQAMAPAAKGGFNPMADAPLTDGSLAVTYASEGYLPASRYAR
jgi:hypothetical protein